MSTTTKEDQAHFDLAWKAREAKRGKLAQVRDAAAGPRAATRSVAERGQKMVDELGDPSDPVAFGRIDDLNEVVYVGRNSILSPELEVLVSHWGSPDAKRFYTATASEPQGLVLKRSFTSAKNRIVSVEDVIFEKLAQQVERLADEQSFQVTDSLLADLEQDRGIEMRDIVQTIHESQYHVIRRGLKDLLVVQGGPGTGKTAVALHRVAWLLYNHKDSLTADSILVVSPNRAFTHYIRGVLPSLGESDVRHADLTQLGVAGPSGRQESAETISLKGDARMAGLLRRALWNRVRSPQDAQIAVETSQGVVRISPERVRRAIDRRKRGGFKTAYNVQRAQLKQTIESLVNKTPGSPVAIPASLERVTERIWPSLTPARFIQDLLGSKQRLMEAAGDEFRVGDIDRLFRPSAANLSSEEWSYADVALLDEANELINGRTDRYAHIVVDEAQDLSGMQLRSLARRSSSGSFTIVGDLAQSTGPWARDTWDDVFKALKTSQNSPVLETLEYGYRVPRQVFDLALPLSRIAAPSVKPPKVVRDSSREPVIAACTSDEISARVLAEAKAYAGDGLLVGVVAPESLLDSLRADFAAAEMNVKSPSDGHLGTSINLMSASEAKGLEFDAVVVVEPAGIVEESPHGCRLLYIALTRSTRFASIVFSRDVPEMELYGPKKVEEAVETSSPALPVVETTVEVVSGVATDAASTTATQSSAPRGKRTQRGERIVAEAVEEIAGDIEVTLAKPLHAYFIQKLADKLGVECIVDD